MRDQSSLFSLEEESHYLNCAYMSPLLRSVEEAGIQALQKRRNPQGFGLDDFFDPVQKIKDLFSSLINNSDSDRIAIIPSVSYGLASAAENIAVKPGGNIILIEDQFPSNYYVWKRKAAESGMKLKIVGRPSKGSWTEEIRMSIGPDTAAVAMPIVHWADGHLFDLHSIHRACCENGAYTIIDGTQSIGALPFDLKDCPVDALICAGYKWLMGPYGMGVAYYGERFDNGRPLEESWFAKLKSDDFAHLVNYQDKFRPKAWRYSVGESSNFVYAEMMVKALEQILDWGPESIQSHCRSITEDFRSEYTGMLLKEERQGMRSEHLFGLKCPEDFEWHKFQHFCAGRYVYVSRRGNYIRISPHVYNSEEDLGVLDSCLKSLLPNKYHTA